MKKQKKTQNTSKGILGKKRDRRDYIKPNTQYALILQWLQQPNGITNYEMHTRGINSATARIAELRNMGFNITDAYEPFTNQFGNTIKIKRYRLQV
ncbi:MAG: helix-turn-helix domain-containing protein [Neisseria sp.]|nr:helix-turn-helix domain-containing protein [Neisseria sp.]